MKKILLVLLISFIAKPDYSAIGLELGKQGDVDTTFVSFDQVNPKFRVTTLVGRAEAFGESATGQGLGLAYAFGNFNEGSFYAGIAYVRAEAFGETESDTGGAFGYAKASGEGLDFDLSISDDADISIGVTQWFEDGLGLGAGLGFPDEENADTSIGVTLYYKW
jgi:hypothetical protein